MDDEKDEAVVADVTVEDAEEKNGDTKEDSEEKSEESNEEAETPAE